MLIFSWSSWYMKPARPLMPHLLTMLCASMVADLKSDEAPGVFFCQ